MTFAQVDDGGRGEGIPPQGKGENPVSSDKQPVPQDTDKPGLSSSPTLTVCIVVDG